jgi:hypothetical protein
MDEVASLNGQVNAIEFGDVNAHAKPDMVSLSIEIVEVESNVKDTALIVDFVLDVDSCAVCVKPDARPILYEPTNDVQLRSDERLINSTLS